MNRASNSGFSKMANRQGANALLTATLKFLRENNIPKDLVLGAVGEIYESYKPKISIRQYRMLMRTYENMGIVMSTWFNSPKFTDKESQPLPLTLGAGSRSVSGLIRASRVSISARVAVEFMRRSPSIKIDAFGNVTALRREFVLPDFAVPRAALVIARYFDTLSRNYSRKRNKPILLLERNCHVPQVNTNSIAPMLRDIKKRGSAYIDSVNGDIEGLRRRSTKNKGDGELSVHIFAWIRQSKVGRSHR